MKKLFLSIAIFVMALCVNAQTNQYFWLNGNLMLGSQISSVDSITFGEEETDSIMLFLPRTIIKTLEIHDTIRVTVHDTIRINENTSSTQIPEGALSGEFSVSPTKKIRFSKGNLQYQATTETWRFAENQWDFVGDETDGTVYKDEVKCNNALISETYDGWIDLFGLGTGNNPTNVSTNNSEYSIFVDWGNNLSSNSEWRTLSIEEWIYLLNDRPNALLSSSATVNGIHGKILLPDNWIQPEGINFVSGTGNWAQNSYSLELWKTMEQAGAVFLPVCGSRYGTNVNYDLSPAHYWSSTLETEGFAYVFHFGFNNGEEGGAGSFDYLCDGFSVRLVHDVASDNDESTLETPTIIHDTIYITIHDTVCPNDILEGALAGEFSVSATKKVRFSKGNLQCIMADTTWRFADNQWEAIGKRNTNIETWGDTIDLFGWSSPNNYYGITMSENDNDYDGLFVEWGTLIGDNWRTLSGAEWNYLVRSRNNHEILIAVGSVNGINGCIILPDTWIIPQGISFNPGTAAEASVDAYSTVNTYSKEEWEKEALEYKVCDEKYILCYFLGSNIEHRKYVEKIKEKTG